MQGAQRDGHTLGTLAETLPDRERVWRTIDKAAVRRRAWVKLGDVTKWETTVAAFAQMDAWVDEGRVNLQRARR